MKHKSSTKLGMVSSLAWDHLVVATISIKFHGHAETEILKSVNNSFVLLEHDDISASGVRMSCHLKDICK